MKSLMKSKPLENRMVIDSEWRDIEYVRKEPQKPKEVGYTDPSTGIFIAEEDAFNYALERCLRGTPDDQKEFKEMLLEWFYQFWDKEE